MRAAVLDASALAALLFAEPNARHVLAAIAGRGLVAPDLLRYEISNVCLSKIAHNARAAGPIMTQFRKWEQLGIKLYAVSSESLIETARKSKMTAYDAAYLVLAKILDADLVTLDGALQRARDSEAES